MVTAFHHGVKTQYTDTVPRPVRVVPSAAVFVVGTAPIYLLESGNRYVNEPIQCLSDVDDALYVGAKRPGFTLPSALDALRDHQAYYVDVVNVFDPAVHKTTATAITYTFGTNGTIQLKRVDGSTPIAAENAEGLTGTFTVTNVAGSTTYTLTTDYTYNATTGVLTRTSGGAISSGASVKVTYTYADPGQVDAADIIGAVTGGGLRTGMQLALDIYSLRGYKSKILIAPGFSELAGVASEMEVVSDKIECVFLLDAPEGTTRAEAITGRDGSGVAANFGTSSSRAILCFPHVFNSANELEPLSQRAAGVMAQTDQEFGYWWSPSNKPIKGIIGAEVRLTADITNESTEVNSLNEVGITTVFQDFGTGYLLWGNRTALYPSDTTPLNFIPVRRTLDIFHESLARATKPFIDRPINNALVDAIIATAQGFIREQAILGAVLPGSTIAYNVANNPPTQLAAGRIVFDVSIMIPTPAETIVYQTTLDISLLSGITGTNAA